MASPKIVPFNKENMACCENAGIPKEVSQKDALQDALNCVDEFADIIIIGMSSRGELHYWCSDMSKERILWLLRRLLHYKEQEFFG